MKEGDFRYTQTFKKTGIDIYTFIICSEMKKKIDDICKLLDIKHIPKKLFTDYKLNTDFKKTLYTDKFEILFIGLNKEKNCSHKELYNTYGKLGVHMNDLSEGPKRINVYLISTNPNEIKNEVISYILGFYNFNKFKTDESTTSKTSKTPITYFYHRQKKFKNIINEAIYEAHIQNEIRSLINTPANILNSKSYLAYIKNNLPPDVNLRILNESQLKKQGLNLILGVNQGSSNKPMLIILEYSHNSTEKPIALIGKGVMFDTGGYNIKMGDFSDMKNDMAGSAIIFGIFKLLSHFKVKGNYVGLLPIVENMVDAKSIRPGDILTAYNKKTIEIIDTDAEGRLILADALAYSGKFKPRMCIDVATLTGQAASIFGNKSSVIMGNNNKYIQQMIIAGNANNEKIWELPMWEEYVSLTKSNIADLKNYSYESNAGTIMAGAFLSHFLPQNAIWLHLDIAGVDALKSDTEMRHYGATGEIMRSIFYFLQNINM